VLLVKPSYRRGWGLPGGALKRNEQSADAVRRETIEETGIEIDVARPIEVYVQRKRRHIDHLFLLRLPQKQQPQPKSEAEISKAGWFSLDELPPLQTEACEALAQLKRKTLEQAA
jgi:ADP-ribose pyrophosphatase YjhB (NUDIX family)